MIYLKYIKLYWGISMKKSIIFIFVYLLLCGILLFTIWYILKPRYSKETDPHKYLKFELLEDDTYAVTGFTKKRVKELIIPSTHKNKPVTTIKENAFKTRKGIWGINLSLPIKKLVIEDGIKIIEKEAFYETGLEETILPDSIEYIGDAAFAKNKTTINIPENISYIGNEAFFSTNLSGDIFIKNIEIGSFAFAETKIKNVTFDDEVEKINDHLFRGCRELTQVTLPKNLKEIGDYAFDSTNSLKSIEFPDLLEFIGEGAFRYSGLTSLSFKGNAPNTIENFAFYNNDNLTTIDFLSTFISKGRLIFANCSNLNNVNFYNTTSIDAEIFFEAPLKNMTVASTNPVYEMINGGVARKSKEGYELVLGGNQLNNIDGFVSIGEYALAGRNFDNLFIGKSVKTIKRYAFKHSVINNAYINAEEIESNAFCYTDIIGELSISSKIINKHSFYDTRKYKTLKINEGTEIIKSNAFVSNHELEKKYLPASLKTVEQAAFIYCKGLKEVYYELKEGTPIKLNSGNFIINTSSEKTKDGRYKVKLNDNFKIYVYEEIYSKALELWDEIPTDVKYIYEDNLANHVEIRK